MNPPSTACVSPLPASSVDLKPSSVITRYAKAYCGPAHGQSWSFDAEQPPPERVDLGAADEVHSYRLVHDPRQHRPARDHHGNYLYMPIVYGPAPSVSGPPPSLRPAALSSTPPRVPHHRAAPAAQLVS